MTEDEKQKIKEDLHRQQDTASKATSPLSIPEEMKQQAAIAAFKTASDLNTLLKDQPEQTIAELLRRVNEESPEEYQTNHQIITDIYDRSLTFNIDDEIAFSVGNWSSAHLEPYTTQSTNTDKIEDSEQKQTHQTNLELLNKIHKILESTKIQAMPDKPIKTTAGAVKITEYNADSTDNSGIINLAHFSIKDNDITLKTFSDDYNISDTPQYKEYINGNPTAQYSIYHHEKTHFDHWNYDGFGELYKTPINACKGDRLTETTAHAVEYLSAAQLYTNLKNQNISTLEIKGEKQPIERILENYPKLKETIQKSGFDITNPASVRRIVEISSETWHKTRLKDYSKQNKGATIQGGIFFTVLPWSEQLKVLENEEKTYKDVSERMLKEVDIGQNTIVDLSHCRDLLDTRTTEDAEKLIQKYNTLIAEGRVEEETPIPQLSAKEFKAVDNYLTQKGLKTDTEKMEYMAKFLKNTAYRQTENQDQELAAIIFSYNNNITYPDMLQQTTINNRTILKMGEHYYDITEHISQKRTKEKKQTANQDLTIPRLHRILDNTR